ncbi:hypothetical protein [Corallococcus aberystwythensis]|uniref:Poly A polymerase head domain-containing protein n=1 Tax=Corallococcus aberystwythensis TaxID=2316722 RepID=A0A3A8QJM4_9BACT|nr:hypothetical protein [Corallococcus aberystwythensis]RKH65082.1 hypothetical protein D7W81_17555 [Corallococcus aberystwythensis]
MSSSPTDSAILRDPLRVLRKRLSDFVTRTPLPWHGAVRTLLDVFREHDWQVFLFGGTLRDLLAVSATAAPRDVDLVVAGATGDALREAFSRELVRVNRFGGLRLQVQKLPVDIWTLESTWAFQQRLVPGGDFAHLPQTTFLNVEAVAAELDTRKGRARQVYGETFFRAVREQVLEINLEENPYAGLCVVRSLLTARKLHYALGPRLARYIAHHGSRIDTEELEAVQLSHYGRVHLDRDHLMRLTRIVSGKVGATRPRPIELPHARQLEWKLPRPQQLDWHSREWRSSSREGTVWKSTG